MWMSWESRLTCMLRRFVRLKNDPTDFYAALANIRKVRVECRIEYPSYMPVEVPDGGAYEWAMAERLKRQGIAASATQSASRLLALVRVSRCASPDIRLFSVETRLTRTSARTDRTEMLLWRSFRVVGVTTQRRLWYDVGAVLYGQVEQFVGDHQTANGRISRVP